MPNQRKNKRWTEEEKDLIFRNSNHRCRECGEKHKRSGYGRKWNIDHIYPQSFEQIHDSANLAVNCVECNSRKGNTTTMIDAMEVFSNSLGKATNSSDTRRKNWR